MRSWSSSHLAPCLVCGSYRLLLRAGRAWKTSRLRKALILVMFFVLLTGTVSFQRQASPLGTAEVRVVPVAQPIRRDVTAYVDFTGRTDAVQSVNVVARVTG